jgi:NitT/TauT family transport system ATP-binding protein
VTAGIRVEGASKRFGSVEALRPVDLEVAPGEVVTVLGPSGCGKTTLLRIVAGLERPTGGAVTIDGAPPAAARSAKRIGFVPQSPALLPWRTVTANVRLLQEVNRGGNPHDVPDVDSLLHDVGLVEFRDAHPHELSGGMQQRVALARAFAIGAPYLLMDEPFAALDEITRADMRHLLARLCEPLNTAVLFVTHSLAEAVYLSDRVVVLSSRPGHVVGIERIELPRPRTPVMEDDPDFFAAETRLRHLLHQGVGQ